ncbi:hypothetical protein [Candidatus Odyssella acanthamoebae]|uniref:Uncharacterized protein n=1 Tax=Candidatus Odyssella acanthamoebae TaxID=91604 RepID=A0A077AVR4_9PROT|nr:hypothetical protein [Candidatus Paracaedibacter acanthamoebae]AIK96476.1 hypothetical protein ID47_06545 [Candidatus Paracaedibacter acanthamoebae]
MIRLVSIFTLWMCLIASNAGVRAADSILLEEWEGMVNPTMRELDQVQSISEMITQIYNCLQAGIATEEISVILDVDGTLTNQSDPTYLNPQDTILERGAAVPFVWWLIRQKINVIFSSAWHRVIYGEPLAGFKETLGRLEKLGFKSLLAEMPVVHYEEGEEKNLLVMASGHAVSVKDPAATVAPGSSRKDIYYRQKAYALYYFSKDIASKTKAIFFADDSRGNTDRFKADILDSWRSLYPNLQEISIYTLTDKLTEVDPWHQILGIIHEVGKLKEIGALVAPVPVREEKILAKKDMFACEEGVPSTLLSTDCGSLLRKSADALSSTTESNLQTILSPRRALISSQ